MASDKHGMRKAEGVKKTLVGGMATVAGATALVAALDTQDPARREDRLREAADACAEYGRIAGREGLGAAEPPIAV